MRKDDFDDYNRFFKDYLINVVKLFRLFIEKCGGRVIVFYNKFKGS